MSKTFIKLLSVLTMSFCAIFAADTHIADNVLDFSIYDNHVNISYTLLGRTGDGGHKLVYANSRFYSVFLRDKHTLMLARFRLDGTVEAMQTIVTLSGNNDILTEPSIASYGNDIYISYSSKIGSFNNYVNLLKIPNGNYSSSTAVSWNYNDTSEIFHSTDIAISSTGIINLIVAQRDGVGTVRKVRFYQGNLNNNINLTEQLSSSISESGRALLALRLYIDSNNTLYLMYDSADTSNPPIDAKRLVIRKHNGTGWDSPISLHNSGDYITQHADLLVAGNNDFMVAFSRQQVSGDVMELVFRRASTLAGLANPASEINTKVTERFIFTPKIGITDVGVPVIQYIQNVVSGIYKVSQISLMNNNTWSKPSDGVTEEKGDALYLHNMPNITNDKPYMLWYNKSDHSVRYNRAPNDVIPPWQPVAPTAVHDDSRGVNSGHAQTLNITAVLPARSEKLYYYVTYNAQGLPVEKYVDYIASNKADISVRDNTTSHVYVVAKDDAGNISLTSNVFQIFVPDRTPPQLQFLPVQHDSESFFPTGRTYYLTVNAQDESDITTINVTYNNTIVPASILVQQVSGTSKNIVISFELLLNAEFDPAALEIMVFDKEGNYATGFSNTDDTPPNGTAFITPPNSTALVNTGFPMTITRNIRLVMDAWDIDPGDGSYVSGIRYYKYSENYAEVSNPANISGRKEFPNFVPGDGARSTVNNHMLSAGGEGTAKRIWIRYWDDAGNSYILPNPISIVYDPNAASFDFVEPDGVNDVASDNFTISWLDFYPSDPAADIYLRYEGVISNGGGSTLNVTGDVIDWTTGASHN
ncbi:hypothetical protein NO1_1822, partial [Candidatus Termititenax aidoneus]